MLHISLKRDFRMQTTIESRLIVNVEIIIELEGHCKYLIIPI